MLKLVFKLIKIAVGVALLAAIGLGVYAFMNRSDLVGDALVEMTGNEAAGTLAVKVMNGQDLTDREIIDALGIDKATYAKIEQAANEMGIDLNDGKQVQGVAAANADKSSEVRDIAERAKAGKITGDEAVKLLQDLITVPGKG